MVNFPAEADRALRLRGARARRLRGRRHGGPAPTRPGRRAGEPDWLASPRRRASSRTTTSRCRRIGSRRSPRSRRDAARLLVLDRRSGACRDARVTDLGRAPPGGGLPGRERHARPARAAARAARGGERRTSRSCSFTRSARRRRTGRRSCGPARRCPVGAVIALADGAARATVTAREELGRACVRLEGPGHVPAFPRGPRAAPAAALHPPVPDARRRRTGRATRPSTRPGPAPSPRRRPASTSPRSSSRTWARGGSRSTG